MPYHRVVACVLSLAFVLLSLVWRDFILDDSFITYRYSENLALHGQITWNLGHDPVEGFTSFLWMLVNAAGIAIGASAVVTSQLVSILAVCVMITLTCLVARPAPIMLTLALVASLAFSPVAALHATQGMETSLAGLLYFLSALGLIRFLQTSRVGWSSLWIICAVLSFMTRPEAAIFQVPAFLVALGLMTGSQRRLTALPALVAIAFCVAYTAFRYWQFGYLFPNTFYIKGSSETLRWSGAGYMGRFVQEMLAPYLVIWLAIFALSLRSAGSGLRVYVPVTVGLVIACVYLMTILPIQGYLHRFAYPLFPTMILLCALQAADLYRASEAPVLSNIARTIAVVMLGLVTLWPLTSWTQVTYETSIRSQVDRVLVGQALSDLEGRMFVTEAGALPYYSRWVSTDHLGLNDEVIAHEGRLTRAHIDQFAPDLIMALFREPVDWTIYPVMLAYMAENGFVPVSVNFKTNYPNAQVSAQQVHVYFLNPAAEMSPEIIARITGIEGIQYLETAPYRESFETAIP